MTQRTKTRDRSLESDDGKQCPVQQRTGHPEQEPPEVVRARRRGQTAVLAAGLCFLCCEVDVYAQATDSLDTPAARGVGGEPIRDEAGAPVELPGATQARPLGVLSDRPRIRPTRTSTPPVIDGRLDDPTWERAVKITQFTQFEPIDGAAPTEPTDMYVAYDSDNLYFGFYAYYSDPSILRSNRVDRDTAWNDDLLTIYFDTFMDQQRSYDFDVNAHNVQGDGIIDLAGRRDRGAGIPSADRSWDTLFDSGAQMVDDGFTAEMAIPFKSLRYPELPNDVPHRWGFQFVREIKEHNRENIVWAPMTRDVRSFMGQMGVLEGMTDLSTSRNLEFLPTFTGINFGALDPATGEFPTSNNPEAGLNVKYGVTSNLTADFTVNPDFSQIESDQPQIEVNQRFPLFFPELRPFFVEGNEVFNINGPVTLVHTRTIVDPLFGTKLTGKVGKMAVGLLAANDQAPGNLEDETDPLFGRTAQTFIGRARYDLFTESHIGAIVTHRDFLDSRSTLAGVDAGLRLSPIHSVSVTAVGSQNRQLDGLETAGHVVDLQLRQNARHFDWFLGAYEITPDFDTRVGFVQRRNQRRVNGSASYRWFPQHWIIDWGPRVWYGRNWDFEGVLEDEDLWASVNFSFARNLRFGTEIDREIERFGGIDFEKGRYWFWGGLNERLWSLNLGLDAGDQIFFDPAQPFLGYERRNRVNLTLRPLSRMQTQLSMDTSHFTDPRRDDEEVFDVKITRLQTTFTLTDRFLVRNIAEFNSFDKQLDFNLLFTYRVNGGTVFYVGYDDHYQQERLIQGLDPIQERFILSEHYRRTNRAFFTKLQYLFRY